jgi:hypothetical protein
MKKVMIFAALLVGSMSFAQGTPTNATAKHPCKAIVQACEAGGYQKGAHKTDGKGLWKDCYHKVMTGQTVAGVNVSSTDVSACQARKAAKASKNSKIK